MHTRSSCGDGATWSLGGTRMAWKAVKVAEKQDAVTNQCKRDGEIVVVNVCKVGRSANSWPRITKDVQLNLHLHHAIKDGGGDRRPSAEQNEENPTFQPHYIDGLTSGQHIIWCRWGDQKILMEIVRWSWVCGQSINIIFKVVAPLGKNNKNLFQHFFLISTHVRCGFNITDHRHWKKSIKMFYDTSFYSIRN